MRPRVQRAPGLPCALLLFEGANEMENLGQNHVARTRKCVFSRHRPRRRTIQYSRALMMESKSRSVLDTPLSRSMTTFKGAALFVSTYARAYGSLRSQGRRGLAIAGVTNPIPAPGWRCRPRSGPASVHPCLARRRYGRPDYIRPCRRDSRCPSGCDRGRTRRSGRRAGDS